MNNKEIYNGFKNVESQMKLLLTRFSELREETNTILEKNSELEIENQHLRELLDTKTAGSKSPAAHHEKPKEQRRNESRKTLEKLFDAGFHVCNQFYGKPRENGEGCMFCDEILNRK